MLEQFQVADATSWAKYKRIRQGDIPNAGTAAKKPVEPTLAPPAASAGNKPASTPQESASKPQPGKGKPAPEQIVAPIKPTQTGGWWAYYAGKMKIAANPYYDPHGINFKWAYSRKEPLPKSPRIVVHMHGSGGGNGAMQVFGPSAKGDIEVRVQDAQAYSPYWVQWWTFGTNGLPYPGRRIVAALEFLEKRYSIDASKRGIVLDGNSMGGVGAVIQTMILPDPWRRRIAYSSGKAGVVMPRLVAKRDPQQYATLPPDQPANSAVWRSIDFAIQAAFDPVVRGIHYRHAFSSDDLFSRGLEGSTQLEFVNLVERHKIGGAFSWVKAGHDTYEPGVALPNLSQFESEEQDVSLDRAHPAITSSSGNYPRAPAQRVNEAKFPRGHYNMGITWNHAKIIDDASQIVFPLKYSRRTGIGHGVPDQPKGITINVTPRRPRNFVLTDGETLKWSWDGGALSGVATVTGDTVTIEAIPLISGDKYRKLRIYR